MDDADELRRIKGVGAARAQWLREEMGVRTAADLAALDPEEIARRHRERGPGRLTREAAEALVANARELTGAPTAWATRASYVIEFQAAVGAEGATVWRTTAGDESGRREATWEGLRADAVAAWIAEGLQEIAGPPPAVPVEEGEPAPPAPAAGGGATLDAGGRVLDGEGYRAARLVAVGAPWSVDVWWEVAGGMLRGPGEWRIDVLLSPIGRSAPLAVPAVVVAVRDDDRGGRHEHRVAVPAGLVTPAHCAAPYRAVVTLTYGRPAAGPPALATALDLGLVRFFDPARAREAAGRR